VSAASPGTLSSKVVGRGKRFSRARPEAAYASVPAGAGSGAAAPCPQRALRQGRTRRVGPGTL